MEDRSGLRGNKGGGGRWPPDAPPPGARPPSACPARRGLPAEAARSPLGGTLLFPRHQALWDLVAPRIEGRDLAHDSLHALRVYRWVIRLAPEVAADPDLAGAAALVHDLDPTGKQEKDRARAAERSSRTAGPLLDASGYGLEERQAILEAVLSSSWSSGLSPAGPLGAVLQDADRLDALGAVGIARVFACHQAMAASGAPGALYHPADPFAETGRPLDDRRHALDHFAVKLLRLADGMHTNTARREAQRRHETMLGFLSQLFTEL